MTYGETFLIWFRRILICLLVIAVLGMAITSVHRARAAASRSDAVISRADYLLNKYGR